MSNRGNPKVLPEVGPKVRRRKPSKKKEKKGLRAQLESFRRSKAPVIHSTASVVGASPIRGGGSGWAGNFFGYVSPLLDRVKGAFALGTRTHRTGRDDSDDSDDSDSDEEIAAAQGRIDALRKKKKRKNEQQSSKQDSSENESAKRSKRKHCRKEPVTQQVTAHLTHGGAKPSGAMLFCSVDGEHRVD
jgi:hypothetical protein